MPIRLVDQGLLVAWLLVAPSTVLGADDDLSVGDAAPPLVVSDWIQGEPVASFEPGTVYVVAFWASWSPSSRRWLPELAELQKNHTDVVFVGIDLWEENRAAGARFVRESKPMPGCQVALDSVPSGGSPGDGIMARTWMKAAGQSGVPTFFVVGKDGRVAWIGLPPLSGLSAILEAISRGTFDPQSEIQAFRSARARRLKVEALAETLRRMGGRHEAARSGLLEELTALLAEDPDAESWLGDLEFALLLAQREDDAAACAERLAVKTPHRDTPVVLNMLAWSLIDPRFRPKPGQAARVVALELAKQAVAQARDDRVDPLDTLALALFLNGDPRAALAVQDRALRLAREATERTGVVADPDLEKRFEQYRAAIEPAASDQ
jgi:thiol-disulfide isomerase/thioredoxin